ncbi:MAG TPA: Asp-tRNA(Asn)/Glu-tRNA(Gln) amidotransferase GatCAB subunit B, partial [Candidatus Dormibacteraeota bacterium]|nr:Asp-tRNA(Asn)/Glu-tRNA(Gln) amidotransferase GatCAB subunit B [Candidatus Dormibacteraeota bacterium]
NWVVGEVNRAVKEGEGVGGLNVRPLGLAALVQRKLDGTISNNQARELFAALSASGEPVTDAAAVDRMIESRGLRQVTDTSQLEAWVEAAITAQPQAAADFRGGNDRAVGRLVGAVMQASDGKANGPAVSEMLRQKLRG